MSFGQYCREMYLEVQSKAYGGAFFAEIVKDLYPFTIFAKKLYHRCLRGF